MDRQPPQPQQRDRQETVTRPERHHRLSWIAAPGLLGGLLGGLGGWGLWTGNGVLWFLSIAGVLALTLQLHFAWERRRLGLQVDEEGVHELLADGRQRTLRWEEIRGVLRKPPSPVQGWILFPKTGMSSSAIEFDTRLQDAHALALLIHARVHHLPLIPPNALPAPSAEEIGRLFQHLPPVRLWNVPFLLRWSGAGCLSGPLWTTAVWGLLAMGDWALALFALAVPALLWLWLRLIPLWVEVDEEAVTLHYVGGGRAAQPWREITGRDGATVRGLYHDLSLEGGPWGSNRVLDLIDHLIARRNEMGAMELRDQPSQAALALVDPEAAAPPSAAALAEPEEKARMSGRELEERAERRRIQGTVEEKG